MDHYPKNIKPFLWEHSLSVVNTVGRPKCCMPYMPISPSWCVMCQIHSKSPTHLFMHCSFASQLWNIILDAFDWSLACFDNIFVILASLLVGHPFYGNKKMV